MSDTMMVSISGMRGHVGTDLTPELVARHAAALGAWLRSAGGSAAVIGRDARTSGEMYALAAAAGFASVGVDVIDVGVVPTPTVQMAVEHHRAGAGLIITASHNPIEWNALKFLGPDGIFLDGAAGEAVRRLADEGPPRSGWDAIGRRTEDHEAVARHLDAIVGLDLIDAPLIRAAGFTVALDAVRGAGGPPMAALFERLGVAMHGIYLEPTGRFPRPPEPTPAGLAELGELVRSRGAALGMAVDPDVDRLALVDETGTPIGEDYTLALAVRAILEAAGPRARGARVVVNLSTSLVVADAAGDYGAELVRAPVGEANVARAIQSEGALIGGEGNGGVMYPGLHVGRDAPLAAALILQYMARQGRPLSAVVADAPRYVIVKAKAPRGGDLAATYAALRAAFPDADRDERDGLRLGWTDRWLHVRPSGTEPIIRLIAEAPTGAEAEELVATARSA
jgi:phosphomannomutase